MSILVFLEHHDGELQKGSLGVLAKAASLGDADAVLVGDGVSALAAEAGRTARRRCTSPRTRRSTRRSRSRAST